MQTTNNEKCHLIDPSELSSGAHNFKFFNFKQELFEQFQGKYTYDLY